MLDPVYGSYVFNTMSGRSKYGLFFISCTLYHLSDMHADALQRKTQFTERASTFASFKVMVWSRMYLRTKLRCLRCVWT